MDDDTSPQPDDFHHLRTHLTMIKGYTQLLQRESLRVNDTHPRFGQYIETVLTHIELLTRRITSMEARKWGRDIGERDEPIERPPPTQYDAEAGHR
jgi:hypothetical protein